MEKYLGVKLIEAEPCLGSGGNNAGKDGYFVKYEDGYESWSPKDVFEKAYRPIKEWRDKMKVDGENQEYMTRVIAEAYELQIKVDKLNEFIVNNKIFTLISDAEQVRLKQQLMAMQYYLTLLVERINNF